MKEVYEYFKKMPKDERIEHVLLKKERIEMD